MREKLKAINLASPDAIVELHLSDEHVDAILALFESKIEEITKGIQKLAKPPSLDGKQIGDASAYNHALYDALKDIRQKIGESK